MYNSLLLIFKTVWQLNPNSLTFSDVMQCKLFVEMNSKYKLPCLCFCYIDLYIDFNINFANYNHSLVISLHQLHVIVI